MMMKSLSELLIIIIFIINYDDATPHHSESNSDSSTVVREKRQVSGCILPEFPENGKWSILNGKKLAGESVPASTALRFECFQGYKLSSSAYVVCDQNWSGPFPECLKTCPARYSTKTTILTCYDNNGYKISCSEATSGTHLTYKCIDDHIYEVIWRRKRLIYCEDGDWSHTNPECQPVCGKKNVNAKPLSFNSEDAKLYEYPWVSAIYLKINSSWKNNCGGTLIAPRIVLTAAHCVSHEGKALPKEDVLVAVGKHYLEYGDSRDVKAQYRELSSILLNGDYNAERRYQYDIALLVVKYSFTLGPEVQPACYDDLPLPPVSSVGEIAGWGITEEGIQPDHLKTLTIYHKNQTGCTNELPSEFVDKYYFHDKMCAGFFHQNKSVCRGDSGSGLVFLNSYDNRYYVQGIVSIAPTSNNGACNSQVNTLLTKVSEYYKWIERQSTIIERCKLPPYPLNGKWELQNGLNRSPGQTVQYPTTILVFTCHPGYILDSVDSKYYCASPIFPKCEKLCPLLNSTIYATIECVDGTNQKILCSDAAEGASMTLICPLKSGRHQQSGTIRCKDGNWNGPQPECGMEKPQGPPMSWGCLLPSHPENGKWQVQGHNASLEPGKRVATNTILSFSCESGHKVSGVKHILCSSDDWSGEPPKCTGEDNIQVLCPPLYSTNTIKVNCYNSDRIEIRCDEATDGATAEYKCPPYYEPSEKIVQNRICIYKNWNLPSPRCIPVCGEKTVSEEPLIVGGQNVPRGNYPWGVEVFKKLGTLFEAYCAGFMLSQRVILTAARCVSDRFGDASSTDSFKVAVGKYYMRFGDARDYRAQYSDVEKIIIHPSYMGGQHKFEIAFLITTDILSLSNVVQPVCYSNLNRIHLRYGDEGILSGWHSSIDLFDPLKEISKEISVYYKDDETCTRKFSPQADKFYMVDKFCAVPNNHYQGTGLPCIDGRGEGLVFRNPSDNRFYLHGIAESGNCDVGFYTNVTMYYDWIDKVVLQYSP